MATKCKKIVEPVEAEAPKPAFLGEAPNPSARYCLFCNHSYIEPCDGNNPVCANRVFVVGLEKA